MLQRIVRLPLVSRVHRLWMFLAGVVVVVAIGVIDLTTRADISFEVFYLVPIAMVAWASGIVPGIGIAIASILASVLTDRALERLSGDHLVLIWEVFSHFVAYTLLVGIISTRAALRQREELIASLEAAMAEIRTLRGLLPLCAWCGRIRSEEDGRWEPLDQYVSDRSSATFTHGICPDCAKKMESGEPGGPRT